MNLDHFSKTFIMTIFTFSVGTLLENTLNSLNTLKNSSRTI